MNSASCDLISGIEEHVYVEKNGDPLRQRATTIGTRPACAGSSFLTTYSVEERSSTLTV